MPRAVLKNGLIYPLEPLPPDWADGKELWVEQTEDAAADQQDCDLWFAELESMVAQNDPEDVKRLEDALRQADV
jgi:hypothetical protein